MRKQRYTVEIVNRLPQYWKFPYCILGNFAYTTKTVKYIRDEYALTIDNQTNTPGYHFDRLMENVRFPKKLDHMYDNLSFPHKAIPCKLPYAFYVDVRSAYYQLASIYGIDCSLREGRYFAFGETTPPKVLHEHKILRALLISGTQQTSTIKTWKGDYIHARTIRNRNFAPNLHRAIFGTLHAIAASVDDLSVYHHTDGFIVPSWNIDRVFSKLDEIGIQYSIKAEGPSEIYGHGQYRVGDKGTSRRNPHRYSTNNIRHEFRNWWISNLRRGLSYRGGSVEL